LDDVSHMSGKFQASTTTDACPTVVDVEMLAPKADAILEKLTTPDSGQLAEGTTAYGPMRSVELIPGNLSQTKGKPRTQKKQTLRVSYFLSKNSLC